MLKTAFFILATLVVILRTDHVAAAQAVSPDVRGVISRAERKGPGSPDEALVGTVLNEGVKEADTKVVG